MSVRFGQRGQEVSKCLNPDPKMKRHWKQQLEDEVTKKRESLGSTSGDFSKKPRLSDIAKHFQAQGKEQADKALVRWLASAGLSPNVTENQEIKDFFKKAERAEVRGAVCVVLRCG